MSCSRTRCWDTLIYRSYCWGRTSERIVSLTTRPEAGLIEMFRNGDKRSVAVNTAHFLSTLEGCSSATDAKQKAITLSTLVIMTAAIRTSSFTPSMYLAAMFSMLSLLFVKMCWTEYCTAFHAGGSHSFYFVSGCETKARLNQLLGC